MRSKLLLFLSLLTATNAIAQNLPILKAQARYSANSTGKLTYVDSIMHEHHNGRNSKINAPSASYNFPNNGVYNADKSVFANTFKEHRRQFNNAGLITSFIIADYASAPSEETYYVYNSSMLLDTMTHFKYPLYERKVYAYNSGGLVSEVLNFSAPFYPSWMLDARERYNYQNGKLVELVTESAPSPGTWAPFAIDSFVANGSDSSFVRLSWNGSAYIEQLRHNYTRDAGNHVLTDSLFNNGSLTNAHYYAYDAQGRLVSDSLGTSKTEYAYDAQSNLVSIKKPYNSPTADAYLDSFTYNTYRQVTSHFVYEVKGLGMKRYGEGQFYYYEFPVNVPEVATPNTLQLYPIPATSYINLAMQFTKPQAFSVRIFDMQGRLVSNWQEAAQKQYNKQIPLTTMAPGQYTVHILAGNESVSRQFMVVR